MIKPNQLIHRSHNVGTEYLKELHTTAQKQLEHSNKASNQKSTWSFYMASSLDKLSFVSPVRTSKSEMIMKAKKTAEYVQMPAEVKVYADAGIVRKKIF